MASVSLGDIDLHFAWQAWQAWHLVTWTFTLRGRRGQAWHLWHWAGSGGARLSLRCRRGRRGFFCVAGVALGDMDLHFA